MTPARARRFFSTLAVSPEAARVANSVAYGAALGFQLYYVKSLVANPEKTRPTAMRRAGAVTAVVEGGLYDAALARLGDDFLAAQEAHRGKRLILDDLLRAEPGPRREPARRAPRCRIKRVARKAMPRRREDDGEQRKARAVTPRSAQALRSSVLGPAPMMQSAYTEPHDYRALWIPQDRRVEHQLLIALEESSGSPLPALTEANLRPFADPETGLLLPWDEAVGAAGASAVDKAVHEYLLDSRYGDGVLRGAKAFNAARKGK
ncbi:hypothetical protein [Segniliparus rugosus]|uniref:Uncharacterized protein n=1 Tax=Segniliparus rugosus (strain ATCC BAA-974 / DSM 45345 / CCUG 50838 / CIP 108380 / JCM 13579 / CDC 945) TaxID=679197 RepID=E5XVI4_SEGRC|nr:hypothetical protein [Segniliparus rugosus]EFV11641.2 hypothetical protein HMPREF9336_03506 [Segniliparus rugosus ATCC BAA-974]